jgi:hypothetical protein
MSNWSIYTLWWVLAYVPYLLLVMIKSKTIVSNVKRYDNEQVVMYILMEM